MAPRYELTDAQGGASKVRFRASRAFRRRAGDAPQAPALMRGFEPHHVPADAACGGNRIRACIAQGGAGAIIPCNPARKRPVPHDKEIHKARNRAGRCFNKLERFPRIATRYDRKAACFPAFIPIASAITRMR